MVEYGNDQGTAMARTVGIPCGLAAQLILDGLYFACSESPAAVKANDCCISPPTGKITKRGVFAPLEPEIFLPLIELLEKEGLGCKEELVVE